MEQPFNKFLMFRNRLQKLHRHLSKQALRQAVTCYRLYNHDLPEFPFIIEVYEDKLYISEYKRRHSMTEEEHKEWWQESTKVMIDLLGIPSENIFVRTRQRKENRLGQYQKLDERKHEFVVRE